MNSFNLRRLWKYLGIFNEILLQKWRCRALGDLESIPPESIEGKVILITGPTSGIGKAASWALAIHGAHIILACRNETRGENLKREFMERAKQKGLCELSLEVVKLDVSDLDSIMEFANDWRTHKRNLDVLINNAGIFDIGGSRKTNKDGLEQHLLTNYLGPFLLTLGILPCLMSVKKEEGNDFRIVNVVSTMHELTTFDLEDPNLENDGSYSSDRAYAQSKLAMIAFGAELQKRLEWKSESTVCSVHPGEAVTEVARGIPSILQWIYKSLLSYILFTPEEGARSVVYCATAEEARIESRRFHTYFGSNCVGEKPSPDAVDASFRQKLWNWTIEIVKLPEDWKLATLGLGNCTDVESNVTGASV